MLGSGTVEAKCDSFSSSVVVPTFGSGSSWTHNLSSITTIQLNGNNYAIQPNAKYDDWSAKDAHILIHL